MNWKFVKNIYSTTRGRLIPIFLFITISALMAFFVMLFTPFVMMIEKSNKIDLFTSSIVPACNAAIAMFAASAAILSAVLKL